VKADRLARENERGLWATREVWSTFQADGTTSQLDPRAGERPLLQEFIEIRISLDPDT
jgi:hypothetical protein